MSLTRSEKKFSGKVLPTAMNRICRPHAKKRRRHFHSRSSAGRREQTGIPIDFITAKEMHDDHGHKKFWECLADTSANAPFEPSWLAGFLQRERNAPARGPGGAQRPSEHCRNRPVASALLRGRDHFPAAAHARQIHRHSLPHALGNLFGHERTPH